MGGKKANTSKKQKKEAKIIKQASKSKPTKKAKKETTSKKQAKVQGGKKAEARLKGGSKAGYVEPPQPSNSGEFHHVSRIVMFIPCHDTAQVPNLHSRSLS